MRCFLVFMLMILSLSVMAFPTPWPSQEVYDLKLQADASTTANAANLVVDATQTTALAKAAYVATDTITVGSTIDAGSTVATDIVLPANSVITDSYLQIGGTQITSANDNTMAVFCETANDILSAVDLTDIAANTFVQGIQTGTSTTILATDGCTVNYVVGAGASGITAGIWTVIIKYFTKQ